MGEHEPLPEWERLLAAERHLQALLPDAVLVGGTAAALPGGHRLSVDGDHVLEDLKNRFDGCSRRSKLQRDGRRSACEGRC